MTLKEKFDNIIGQSSPIEWENECVQAADEFAIEFAEWIYLDGRDILIFKGLKTTKELLEIYKKEYGR